jgi:hypothetical protein
MIIVRISGGLGNQLFQIGFAYVLANKTKQKVSIDLSFYTDQNHFLYKRYLSFNKIPKRKFEFYSSLPFELCEFDDICNVLLTNENSTIKLLTLKKKFIRTITFLISTSFLLKIISKRVVDERKIDLNNLNCYNIIYSGYWQSRIYFDTYDNKLKKYIYNLLFSRNFFNFKIQFNLNDCIVLHVRKGDYIQINEYFNLDMIYYNNSINYIHKLYPNLNKILIITNDQDWCLNNLQLGDYEFEFSDSNMNLFYDFSILYNAKYIVTSNSTFCFWAAFLGQPIIATIPNLWYRDNGFDYIPDSWQIINCIK